MPYAGEFWPGPDPGEAQSYSIDFGPQLTPTADSIVSVTATLIETAGVDPHPSACLIGAPAVSGTIVTQQIGGSAPGGLLAGGRYVWEVVVVTAQGATRSNYGHINCDAVG